VFAALLVSGCRSHGVIVTVRNHSGAEVRNLEVQYPGGSFGRSLLKNDESYTYRVKVLRPGTVTVAFEDPRGNIHRSTGPDYPANADGTLAVSIDESSNASYSRR
jgi:hypothetical protein